MRVSHKPPRRTTVRTRFITVFSALALAACLPPVTLSAQHAAAAASSGPFVDVNLEQHLEIKNLKTATAPQVRGNSILFTFSETSIGGGPSFTDSTRKTTTEPGTSVKNAYVAFAHEGWAVLHPLTKTNLPEKRTITAPKNPAAAPVWEEESKSPGSPVFYIYWEMDRHVQESLAHSGKDLEYRYVIDGIWMADPLNPSSSRKMNGALVSVFDLSRLAPPAVISPEIHMPVNPTAVTLVRQRPEQATLTALASSRQARTVILRWVGRNDQEVFVAGSFNQFDPYLTPLEAVGADPRHPDRTVYQVELRLLAGQYQYYFVINGEPFPDALNPRQATAAQGPKYSKETRYSQFLVP